MELPQRWHFQNADWERFANLAILNDIPEFFNDVDDMITFFISLVLNAATMCIKRTPGKAKRSVPWWKPECKEVIRNKRNAWKKYKRNKNDSNFIAFKTARAIACKVIRKAKRESWRRYVSSITQWTPVTAIWKKIHKIAGKHVRDNAPVLLHTGEMIAGTKQVADILAEYFFKITRGEHLSIDFLNKKTCR